MAIDGRLFRARRLDIAPGGVVPWHSHGDRPALILIVVGRDHRIRQHLRGADRAQGRRHHARDATRTSHWWKNTGSTPVVIYSFDMFRVEDKTHEHMM